MCDACVSREGAQAYLDERPHVGICVYMGVSKDIVGGKGTGGSLGGRKDPVVQQMSISPALALGEREGLSSVLESSNKGPEFQQAGQEWDIFLDLQADGLGSPGAELA